eukprot:1035136-Pleurochrysis_carterae.AAC.1
MLEHPADRCAISSPLFVHERHAPLWMLPSATALSAEHSAGFERRLTIMRHRRCCTEIHNSTPRAASSA